MCRPPSCCAASATMRSTCSLRVTSAARGTMRRFALIEQGQANFPKVLIFATARCGHPSQKSRNGLLEITVLGTTRSSTRGSSRPDDRVRNGREIRVPAKAVLVGEEKEVGVPRIWVNLEVRTQRCESKNNGRDPPS